MPAAAEQIRAGAETSPARAGKRRNAAIRDFLDRRGSLCGRAPRGERNHPGSGDRASAAGSGQSRRLANLRGSGIPLVDSVSEVIRIARTQIEAAPELSREQAQMIRRPAHLTERQRMLLLLESDRLPDGAELASRGTAAA